MTAVLERVPLRHPPGWQALSSCKTAPDPDWWFADDEATQQRAKRVCAGCAVRGRCLDDALARGEAWGVRGGLDAAERRALAPRLGYPRPSIDGASQHATNGRYASGCRCRPCTDARARYVASWRSRRSSITTRVSLFYVIEKPTGRGLHRAWPGQLALAIGVA